MPENLVFYQSKYGATGQYAAWLEEMIGCDVMELSESLPRNLKDYRNIVIAGGIYKGEIAGREFLKRNMEAFKEHRVGVLAVGAEKFYKGLTEALWLYQFKELEVEVEVFYARGEFDYKNMRFGDRATAYDWKDRSYLEPWVEWMESE